MMQFRPGVNVTFAFSKKPLFDVTESSKTLRMKPLVPPAGIKAPATLLLLIWPSATAGGYLRSSMGTRISAGSSAADVCCMTLLPYRWHARNHGSERRNLVGMGRVGAPALDIAAPQRWRGNPLNGQTRGAHPVLCLHHGVGAARTSRNANRSSAVLKGVLR